MYVDDIKMSVSSRIYQKMTITGEKVAWKDPTPLLDEVYLGCIPREAQVNKRIVLETQFLFTKVITASKDVTSDESDNEHIIAWGCDIQGHAHKCVELCCELAHKTVDELHKVSRICIDDQQLKPEDLESVEELSETCSQNCVGILVCCSDQTHRIIVHTELSCTMGQKVSRAWDKRVATFTSYIHHIAFNKQYF